MACGAGEEVARPNILLVSIDTLRADHLGCYGYERDTSPFIDSLAARGTLFLQARVNTHGTTPSHATLLSSLYQRSHGVHLDPEAPTAVPDDITLLPEILQEAGYATLGVTGGGNVGRGFGFDQGFDLFDDRSRDVATGVDRLLAAVRDQLGRSSAPVFAFFHTYEVHSPYQPPAPFDTYFGTSDSDFEPTSDNLRRHIRSVARTLSPDDLEHIRQRYDAGIRYTDSELRRLFDGLSELGFFDRYLLVLTSDHGEELGEHGGLLHRSLLYDELLAVPLILGGDALPAGRTRSEPVSTVDVLPTLLACAGLPPWPAAQGRALDCDEGSPAPADATVSQYGTRRYAVTADGWKLIVTPELDRQELYHLGSDPAERRDLIAEHPERAERLRAVLRRWRAERSLVRDHGTVPDLSPADREQLRALGYAAP